MSLRQSNINEAQAELPVRGPDQMFGTAILMQFLSRPIADGWIVIGLSKDS